MPKHGWKWRTIRFLELSLEERETLLNDWKIHISARFAKWAYAQVPLSDRSRRAALIVMGFDKASSKVDRFLMSELDKTWQLPIGGFVVSALGRQSSWNQALMRRFEELFHDSNAHPEVRGMCLHALGYNYFRCPYQQLEAFEDRLRMMCTKALWDENHPELRRLACLPACFVGGFGKRIHELIDDLSVDTYGNTVASQAIEWDLLPNE